MAQMTIILFKRMRKFEENKLYLIKKNMKQFHLLKKKRDNFSKIKNILNIIILIAFIYEIL